MCHDTYNTAIAPLKHESGDPEVHTVGGLCFAIILFMAGSCSFNPAAKYMAAYMFM